MSTIETKLGDLLADGKLTDEDAHHVRAYAQYLADLAGQPGRGLPLAERWRQFSPEFRARWRAYLLGDADGPST